MKATCDSSWNKATARLQGAVRRSLFRLHGCLHDTVTIPTLQGRLTIPTHDRGIASSLYQRRQYEFDSSRRTIAFLKDHNLIPRRGATMFDIGANLGMISIGLVLAGDIERALAIEPEPTNFKLLSRNVAQNHLTDRIVCFPAALGAQVATLTMELSPKNPGDHRIRTRPTSDAQERHGESQRPTVEVPSLPLDQVVQRAEVAEAGLAAPSLVWLDVQGYEGYVFEGGRKLLNAGVPAVAEIWPYGILRAGMSLERFAAIVGEFWTDYWVERRGRFVRYPIEVFDRLLDELGDDGHFENVVFTRAVSGAASPFPRPR
ncbi:MAG: FkbM family methyltransferase [Pirellulales bacterium]